MQAAKVVDLVVEPLAGPMGAMVSGMDFAVEVDDLARQVIFNALRDHQLLVFRGHRAPSDAELVRFGALFGELNRNDVAPEQTRPGYPEILAVSNIVKDGKKVGTAGSGNLDWHTDYSYQERVGKVSILEAVLLPEEGGSTDYTNLYAAYEALPAERRHQLDGLQGVHRTASASNYQSDPERPISEAVHPVVVSHPDTGRRTLYVSPLFTKEIVGMSDDDGRSLLEDLFAHSTSPAFIYQHYWQVGDLAVWDDVGTLHRRDPFDPASRRYMRQMTTLVSSGQGMQHA